ncbi:MAG: shikimate kinase [Gemmatimonadetes bacterium]|nr:shikimate kinase [Gemmatimonadota bacterium]
MGETLNRPDFKRLVLLGFMGAGKSSVGPILARRFAWEFIDLDSEIERSARHSIPEIFASKGEAAFRKIEAEVTTRVIGRERIVLAPGGGWLANEQVAERGSAGTVTVWLRVSPEEVLRRVGSRRDGRPLLAVADPDAAVRRLLSQREPLYREADLTVDTDGRTAQAVATEIETLLNLRGSAAI